MENKTTKPICNHTDTSVKNQLQDAQIVTNKATPKAKNLTKERGDKGEGQKKKSHQA